MADECLFCKIIKGEIPADKVYEDNNALVILDIRPASLHGGHLLVMPKKHYLTLEDLDPKEFKPLMETIQKMTKVLLKLAPGVNLLQNNKPAAGQFVNHLHFHLIPRYENDGIIVEKWSGHQYPSDEAKKQVLEKIKSFL